MRRNAFTLIELLAAMGIIVLLSAIALSSTRSIRDGLRLASGVNAATAALELGRSIAIEKRRACTGCIQAIVAIS